MGERFGHNKMIKINYTVDYLSFHRENRNRPSYNLHVHITAMRMNLTKIYIYSLFHQDLGVAFFQFARSLFKIF